MARTIWSCVGSGIVSSNAAAAMIMPAAQ